MMLKASLDAFDDSMALHEEDDMNQPETQMKHDAQELSVASNANGDIRETNSITRASAKAFADDLTQMETLLMMRKKLYY